MNDNRLLWQNIDALGEAVRALNAKTEAMAKVVERLSRLLIPDLPPYPFGEEDDATFD